MIKSNQVLLAFSKLPLKRIAWQKMHNVIKSAKSAKFSLITFIWLLYSSVHSEPVVCEICGSTRKSQTTLLGHMRRAHPPPEVAFKCGVCNKYDLISYFAVNQKNNNNKINLLPIDRHLWFVVKFLFWDFWYHKCF